jgi:SAM-dependent methyltransferase
MADAELARLRAKWDRRHAEAPEVGSPAEVLVDCAHLLPAQGTALDLACGRGGNALWLAEHTRLAVHAWDLSAVAIARLAGEAQARGLSIDARVRDVLAAPPPAAGFDVIVVGYFLERTLFPDLAAALRPGGLLFYQTFTRDAVSERGPKTPEWRLETNELLALLPGLIVRAYREEGSIGDTARGLRDVAYVVAEKPIS